MTTERLLIAVLVVLVLALTGENIYLVVQAESHSPLVIDACPQPKGK